MNLFIPAPEGGHCIPLTGFPYIIPRGNPNPIGAKAMDRDTEDNAAGKCPVVHTTRARANRDWWPNQLDLHVLHQHSGREDPMGGDFDYAKEFKSLDLNAVIKDLHALMTDSQEWWPA